MEEVRVRPRLWSYGELNPGPLACHASALPTELQPRCGPGMPGDLGLLYTLHGQGLQIHCGRRRGGRGEVHEVSTIGGALPGYGGSG
ncbi:hypothetical protein SCOCK_20178 [Actinacidiphila cocklensis]|uniref:Uncharacterized protein n=1 Tax=Actinacidiphila cocklensis TaxID=887465 RepID=A0A9W4GQD4_9ACTN|nr:hypothetical protein SCOCK_20178 [Actinacidiphila cocklensis]